MTPDVDHLIRYHDDPGFRALYANAVFRLAQDPGRLAKRYLVRGSRVFSLPPLTKFLVRPRTPLSAATTGATEPVLH